MTAGLRARPRKSEPDYGAIVTKAYSVVPKPRHSAEAPWNAHKGGFPKPRGWRARSSWYHRGTVSTQSSESKGLHTFDGEPVGADIAPEPKAKPEIKVAWNPIYLAEKERERIERERDEARARAVSEARADIAARAAAEPAPVVVPEPVAPAPIALACTCEADAPLPAIVDAAAVAAYLRELAGKYGPRRAHKLQAMADFVEGAR